MDEIELMVTIDGETLPLDKCDWLWIDPVGHVIGAALAGNLPREEEAYAEFENTSNGRRLQRSWGFRMELIDHRRFGELATPCMTGKCDHPDLETMGIHVCRLCGRLGKKDFQTVIDKDGKPLLRCVGRTSCRKREIKRYGWRPVR